MRPTVHQIFTHDPAASGLDLNVAKTAPPPARTQRSGPGERLLNRELSALDWNARVLELAGWREAPPVRGRVSMTSRRVEAADLDLPLRAREQLEPTA